MSVVGSVYQQADGDSERFAVIVGGLPGFVEAVILTPGNRIAPVARRGVYALDYFDSAWAPMEVDGDDELIAAGTDPTVTTVIDADEYEDAKRG